MPRFEDRAFILGVADYRETSKLLRLLTESEGKLSLVARGLASPKSQRSAVAEPFSLVRVAYTMRRGSTLGNLAGIEMERACRAVRTDLRAYALANYWFEVVGLAAQPNLPAHDLFVLTGRMLDALDGNHGAEPPILGHLGALLDVLGFGMQLTRCGQCGAKRMLHHFSLETGSAVCARCAGARGDLFPLPAIRRAQTPQDWKTFLELMHRMLASRLEHDLRSYGFLRDTFFGPEAIPGA